MSSTAKFKYTSPFHPGVSELTAPQLFGLAFNHPETVGRNICFFCGGRCGTDTPSSSFVKKSFTSLDTVTLSPWVCNGCVASQNEDAEIQLVDGESRTGQRVRTYSWVISPNPSYPNSSHLQFTAKAATKSHRESLLESCLSPPTTPFVICLADSGQKHLLYRAVVCHDRDNPVVTLEGELIRYSPWQLRERIRLCAAVAAVVGKPVLSEGEPISTSLGIKIIEEYRDKFPNGGAYFGRMVVHSFNEKVSEGLTRLAAWLCPPKEACREFVFDGYPTNSTNSIAFR